ncbi:hypothetical protein ABZ178_27380 [Streptomyces massasporeus]|uniref:hypothetical protein n=1 Tax=Streptomyces massasporeus TaxID=67324 RepID=UPI001675AD7E|nr:hypothetical protein [Streptomyces massasporeus]GGV82914.1 hypothetical protein GCM10010228_58340 [Streptomyces massasporeus]
MHDLADRLDRLCRLLGGGELTRRAREYGVAEYLERVLGAVRDGTDPERVRADLDALDEGFARHGIDGLTTRTRAYQPLSGTVGHPVLRGWVCPAAHRCSRFTRHDTGTPGGDAGPVCEALGTPLVRVEIPL